MTVCISGERMAKGCVVGDDVFINGKLVSMTSQNKGGILMI